METNNNNEDVSHSRRKLDFEQHENEVESHLEIDVESLGLIHGRMSKGSIPRIDMEFGTEEMAYDFYNTYAREVCFSIRKSKFHSFKGKLLDRLFVCSCEGKRGKDKRDNAYKSHHIETRCECLARLKICCRQTGNYRVTQFIPKHNHPLASPGKSYIFRSHRKITVAQAAEIDIMENSEIAPKQGYDFMASQAGGRESLGFTRVDYQNYLQSKRTVEMKSGDTGGVLEYLQKMQIEDPNFFYAIQVDEDDLITNIFWADAKMMADFGDFGDVVCFDTTYRKHKDGRPIALFVGVNHHKQTTIFGAALLYDETAPTFVWLFDTFSRAMDGKLPQTILTDQDHAMAKALAFQWPNTYHRLCVWHIFQNAATHLSNTFAEFKDFATDFSNCVYDYEHEDDFVVAWNDMLKKYGLLDNEWLQKMFKIKEKWALVYGRDTFCADMTTTQRSESMNKVIKHYVSYKHDLRRFFVHFQRLLDDRRYNEMMADFKAKHSIIALTFPVEILKNAATIYTPEVFTSFQVELCKAYDCNIEILGDSGTNMTYTVTPHRKKYSYVVSYDPSVEVISCTCRKFEFAGILCSHTLKVLSMNSVTKVPEKYILKRWTKGAKRGSVTITSESANDVNPKAMIGRRYRDLCRLTTQLNTKAALFEDVFEKVRDGLINLMKEVDLNSLDKPVDSTSMGCHSEKNPSLNGKKKVTGIKLKPKPGSRSSKRPKGALETTKKRAKKKTPSSENITNPSQPTQDSTLIYNHMDAQLNEVINNRQLSQFLSSQTCAPSYTTMSSLAGAYVQNDPAPSYATMSSLMGAYVEPDPTYAKEIRDERVNLGENFTATYRSQAP